MGNKELQVNQDSQDLVDPLDNPVLLDLRVNPAPWVPLALQGHLVLQGNLVKWEIQDCRAHLDLPERQVLPVHQEIKGLPETQDSWDQQDLPGNQVRRVLLVNQDQPAQWVALGQQGRKGLPDQVDQRDQQVVLGQQEQWESRVQHSKVRLDRQGCQGLLGLQDRLDQLENLVMEDCRGQWGVQGYPAALVQRANKVFPANQVQLDLQDNLGSQAKSDHRDNKVHPETLDQQGRWVHRGLQGFQGPLGHRA